MPEDLKAWPIGEPRIERWGAPILIGLLLASITGLLWYMLNEREEEKLHIRVEAEAEKLAAYIEADMRSRIPALQRIVLRWENRGGTPRDEFLSDASAYLADLPGFQAIEWVDSDFKVQWLAPEQGNEAALGMNAAFEEKRRRALEKARAAHAPTMTSVLELVQGGQGFLTCFPIRTRGEFDGFIVGVFRIDKWLEYVFSLESRPEEIEKFKAVVSLNEEVVYRQAGWDELTDSHYSWVQSARVLDHVFKVHLRPTLVFISEESTLMPEAVALVGLIISVLVGFVVHLFQAASGEARRNEAMKQALEKENTERVKTEAKLREASNRLSLAVEAGGIGIWTWDVESSRLTWNELMFQLYDVSPDVVPTYSTWFQSLHPDDAEQAAALIEEAAAGRAVFDTEFRIRLKDGRERHIRAAARLERDQEGRPLRLTGVNWDVTSQKRAENLLATERRRLADILEGTNVGTWEWNVQTGQAVFNERWAGIIGYALEELEPISIETWTKNCHPEDLEKSSELLKEHFEGRLEYYAFEARMKHKSGHWVWVLDRGKVAEWAPDGKPLLMSGTRQDITERKLYEENIRRLANHDALTGLPSLRLARDRLESAISLARREGALAAVLFVDLDGFKAVNDTYGHDAGDDLLKEVAERLLASVREMDTVARIGGDEFLIIASRLQSPENVRQIAEKILEAVSRPFELDQGRARVGASIGAALFPRDGQDVETLIKKSDQAMYQIKNSGKNGFGFASAQDEVQAPAAG